MRIKLLYLQGGCEAVRMYMKFMYILLFIYLFYLFIFFVHVHFKVLHKHSYHRTTQVTHTYIYVHMPEFPATSHRGAGFLDLPILTGISQGLLIQ